MRRRRFFTGGIISVLAVTALSLLMAPGSAQAIDTYFAGPRAMGMAGANVASVDDTTAQYYNPAAFGFMDDRNPNGNRIDSDNNNLGRKTWGFDLNGAAGFRVHKNFGDYVDALASIDYNTLSTQGIQQPSDLVNLIKVLNSLKGLEDPGNAITTDINAGLGIRAGHFAIGGRGDWQIAGRVLNVDTTHLGITNSSTVGDLNNQITNVDPTLNTTTYNRTLITGSLYTQLINAGLTEQSIDIVDSQLAAAGVTSSDVAGFVDNLEQLTGQTLGTLPTGSLSDNTTTVALRSFLSAEVPLSYGYAINDHWAVGANLKLIRGWVYGNQILVFNNDSGAILSHVRDNYKESTNFGLDVGIMGRYHLFNFGLVGRNLNAPKFDGFDKDITLTLPDGTTRMQHVHADDVKLEPQVAAGVAFIPFQTLTLEVDCDLTRNKTLLSNFSSNMDYYTQNLSAGLEWDAFRFLAFRVGAYKNLAENDIGIVYTAGLGVNFWLMRFDLGLAVSGDTAQFSNHKYPKEAHVAAQLSMDF